MQLGVALRRRNPGTRPAPAAPSTEAEGTVATSALNETTVRHIVHDICVKSDASVAFACAVMPANSNKRIEPNWRRQPTQKGDSKYDRFRVSGGLRSCYGVGSDGSCRG